MFWLPRAGAISRLEAAISDDEKAEITLESPQYSRERRQESGSELPRRAWPFLDMMREASKLDADIIWGL